MNAYPRAPTPWYVETADSSDGWADIYGADKCDFAQMAVADAEHIVRCVNVHDELVAALNRVMTQVDPSHCDGCERALEMARAALAKAEAA